MIRRALVALGLAGLVAAVLRVRGIGRRAAPGRRLARALRPDELALIAGCAVASSALGRRRHPGWPASCVSDATTSTSVAPARPAGRTGRRRSSRRSARQADARDRGSVDALADADVVVLAAPGRAPTSARPARFLAAAASRWCRRPTAVDDVRALLDLDPEARERGRAGRGRRRLLARA